MRKGVYIILEGGEGCGKDTQAPLLRDYIEHKGFFPCIITKEPGGTPLAEEIGKRLKSEQMDSQTELLLFEKARKENYNKIIAPSLEKGKSIIKTRGWPSTFAYQGFGGGVNLNLIEELNKKATRGILPDLIILLDILPKKGLEKETVPDKFAKKGIYYHNRVRKGYLWVAKKYESISEIIPYVNGIEKMQERIKKVVDRRLNL